MDHPRYKSEKSKLVSSEKIENRNLKNLVGEISKQAHFVAHFFMNGSKNNNCIFIVIA